MPAETITREVLTSVNLPTGITRTRDGIGWNSETHSLAVQWENMGDDGESGWAWYLHSASGYDSGGLDSLTELSELFARMLAPSR